MKYPNTPQPAGNPVYTGSAAPSGSVVSPQSVAEPLFLPWQPSTWPATPQAFDESFYNTVERIFSETIIEEISNVINDILGSNNNSLEHRGHVIAIVLLCAIDTVASYTYSNITGKGATGGKYIEFIKNHFPTNYQPHAEKIYKLYRNSTVHSWNLFEATMFPGHEPINTNNSTISFGLLDFFEALKYGLTDFLDKLKTDVALQKNVLCRYEELKKTAK